ncbi:MAG: hypothetical protein AAFP89_25460 [Bacteroidota bacterium]
MVLSKTTHYIMGGMLLSLIFTGSLWTNTLKAEEAITIEMKTGWFIFSGNSIGIPYQAVLRDGNQPIANTVVNIRFSIFQNGQLTYQEETLTNSNDFGVINTVVGDGTPTGSSYSFEAIDWTYGPLELQVEMDYDGTGFTDFGMIDVRIPPIAGYALTAGTANSVGNVKLSDLTDVQLSLPDPGEYLTFNGNKWVARAAAFRELSAPSSWEGTGNYKIFGGLRVTDWYHVRDYQHRLGMHSWMHNGAGYLETRGPNSINVSLSTENGSKDWAYLALFDQSNRDQASLFIQNNIGKFRLKGSNGSLNFGVGNPSNNPNNGYFAAYDANGVPRLGGFVGANGDGIIWGTHKYFVINHPNKQDSVIVYGCLEGPELAIYERGTAQLVDGKAFVPLSEESSLLGNPSTMTVMTSPLSASSKSLAVIEKTSAGFYVEELNNGHGSYDFDWEMKMVRKGEEDFAQVRPASEFQSDMTGRAVKANYPEGIKEGEADE